MTSTTVFIGEQLAAYGFGAAHPFGVDRHDAFVSEFYRQGLDKAVNMAEPEIATEQQLVSFHTQAYINQVKQQSVTGQGFLDCGDTPAFKGVYDAGCAVVGTTLAAVRQLMQGTTRRAFIPIAGLHHGRRDSAAGFCVFNDCGVAIEILRKEYGIQKIAYVDIDAHHGDGVFYAFEADPDLCFVDFHEDGKTLYPGTGSADETGQGAAAGTKLNIPMPPNANDALFITLWDAAERFIAEAKPEILLFQCGADSVGGDPITHLNYTAAAHAYAAKRLCALADEYCQGRILAMGGGGYNRDNLAKAWCAVVEAMR